MKQTFFYFLYNLITVLLLPFFILFVAVPLFFQADATKQWSERFALYRGTYFTKKQDQKTFWVHASSVGEVMLSRVFIQALRVRFPDVRLIFSTSTASGQKAAAEHLSNVDQLIYFPYDFFWVIPRALASVSPDLFVFVETEIWPNLLRSLSKRGAMAVMINGRISDRSFPGYQRLKPFLSQVLPLASLFLMQSASDENKIIELGAPKKATRVTGNMKYDQGVSTGSPVKKTAFSDLGLAHDTPLFIAGSTRPGEEEAVIEAWRLLREKQPEVVLLIAPRHLKRVPEIERILKKEALLFIRKTKVSGRFSSPGGGFCPVIVLDTLGELAGLYRLAKYVFVGGGLAPLGGHNPLEAAAHRLPVFFGPHMDNFKEISEALLASGGAQVVNSGPDLGEKLCLLAASEQNYEQRASAAYHCVLEKRGAVNQNTEAIAELLQARGVNT